MYFEFSDIFCKFYFFEIYCFFDFIDVRENILNLRDFKWNGVMV